MTSSKCLHSTELVLIAVMLTNLKHN